MQTFQNYIGGRHVPPGAGQYLETENPFTGMAWARVARSTAADVEQAVQAAHSAFRYGAWKDVTAVERAGMLRNLGDLVKSNVDELASHEVRDNGKTITEMRTQMRNVAEWYYFYAGLADKIAGENLPTERRNYMNYTRLEPFGVVGLIVPWNSPLRLLAWKLAPALAAGNVAVIKPSEFTSTSALAFMALIEKAGFPPGVVSVVTGFGSEVGLPLAAHPLVAKVAFTGGADGGRAVYEAAARGLKPVSLELGGKSPNIIFEDADLANATRGAVAGIFGSGGQTCVAGSRLLVQRSVLVRVLERIVELASRIRMGDPMDPETELGPIANRRQFERILRYVEIGREDGARLVLGGRPAHGPSLDNGLFVEPTIFADVNNRMRIAQEEVFGPLLCVIPFDDEDEAVAIANDTAYGLGAGIWTRDVARAHRVAACLQAGSVWVNTYRVTSQISPFGGYKGSGIGREGGVEMIRSYLQTKSVWVDLNPEFQSPFR